MPGRVELLQPGPDGLVVLSYGLGADSTAILLRWLHEPETRGFELDRLVVVTAMTGDEWPQTGADVEAHVLPLLRRHRIRWIQAARSGRYVTGGGAGITILDDSRQPGAVHLAGAYKLSDEMREAGTVPQTGGARLCSVHAKGDVLDPIIARLAAGPDGRPRPYRHVVGYEAGEPKRAAKDELFNTLLADGHPLRTGVYPLIEWGWDRERCEKLIWALTGVTWQKSACVACPFALSNKASRRRVFARFDADPDAAIGALTMERRAMALNPAQKLVGRDRAVDLLGHDGDGHPQVLAPSSTSLLACPTPSTRSAGSCAPAKTTPPSWPTPPGPSRPSPKATATSCSPTWPTMPAPSPGSAPQLRAPSG